MKVTGLLFVSLFFVLGTISFGQIARDDSFSIPTILFVCEHGAARSTIASVYFNRIAEEKKLNHRAVFRGTDPETTITFGTKKGLGDDGFDTENLKPQAVSQLDIEQATRIITFDCILPTRDSLTTPVYRWDGIPPISKNYGVARNEIVRRVHELIKNLASDSKKK